MNNKEIAKIFYQMADYLKMDNIDFKPFAYERAALSLEGLNEDVADIYKKGGVKALQEIPGIGKSLAGQIEEFLKTGKIKDYEKFSKRLPLDMDELVKVEGLGPRKIKILYNKLGISNLKELEKAAKSRKIAPLFGFGEKTEKNILQGIEFLKRDKGRFLLGQIMPTASQVLEKLESLKDVKKASLAGSLRRKKETIGDVDFLVASDKPERVMDFFVSLPGVEKVWGKGGTKASVRMRDGFDMDLRIVPSKSYGAALQYFTGSKEHNVATRIIAIEKGLKLSEYGLFKGSKIIAGKTEEDVYKTLGLSYIEPELRENRGEIEASRKGILPKLIELKNIKGDLHCHSDWDGGKNSIEEMAESAAGLGYEYIGISDHTKFLHIEKGLDGKQLLEQKRKIGEINSKFKSASWRTNSKKNSKFKILQGCECNIMADGTLDIKDEVLAQLDYVIAGVHSQLKMPKEQMTERLIKAMENPNVDIISHPTGRLVGRRDEYQIDFDKILKIAKKTGTILEINASPERLDLKDIYIKKAKEIGVKMAINTDSHNKSQLTLMEYGISQARRGWAEKEDIINTQPVEKILEFF